MQVQDFSKHSQGKWPIFMTEFIHLQWPVFSVGYTFEGFVMILHVDILLLHVMKHLNINLTSRLWVFPQSLANFREKIWVKGGIFPCASACPKKTRIRLRYLQLKNQYDTTAMWWKRKVSSRGRNSVFQLQNLTIDGYICLVWHSQVMANQYGLRQKHVMNFQHVFN